MSSFTQFSGELDLEYDRATGRHLVLKEFTYDVGALGSGRSVRVPYWFDTDGASVPRILWNLLPPFGQYGQAAVVHDKLYRDGKLLVNGVEVDISREECDAIFLEAMKVLGVNVVTRYTMYYAVRMFGASSFKGVKK